ncbi:hypothetical protein HT102_08520 [Hoyosella sp. G463]|uniref:Uncharacterized protein n=1 Tax=Lolliginicoccus lacisalsi TaxID=2742202 RepID=A0A927PMH4_9ACTN|nr:hypothetical protein [Lolliginicoccus lacisalsi]MBD8506527.1 hypothetical protein [Lolliginicoccus lacisalsi]
MRPRTANRITRVALLVAVLNIGLAGTVAYALDAEATASSTISVVETAPSGSPGNTTICSVR